MPGSTAMPRHADARQLRRDSAVRHQQSYCNAQSRWRPRADKLWNSDAFRKFLIRRINRLFRRCKMVDKDRIKGSAEQAKGKVKEWTGKAVGDKKLEGEGKADQVKGKVQNAIGGLKDAMRGK
jgi:uncharacterized protein YjbJ (UPF0337 family)